MASHKLDKIKVSTKVNAQRNLSFGGKSQFDKIDEGIPSAMLKNKDERKSTQSLNKV